MPQRILLQQQILERVIMLGLLIKKYGRYSAIIKLLYNVTAAFAVILATIVRLLNDGQFNSGPTFLLILSILSFCITKIRDLLQFDHIIHICKEQIIKYKRLLEVVQSLVSAGELDQHIKAFSNLTDFDPQIPNDVVEQFKADCKKEGLTATFDEMAKYAELSKVEVKLDENPPVEVKENQPATLDQPHDKSLSNDDLSPRTRQNITRKEVEQFRNSLDMQISTAKLKKIEKKLENMKIKGGSI